MQEFENAKCEKCGEIHNVELAGGHDLVQADKVARCECSEFNESNFSAKEMGKE